MNPVDFNRNIDDMKMFINLVLKIAFNHLYYDVKGEESSDIYESFFKK